MPATQDKLATLKQKETSLKTTKLEQESSLKQLTSQLAYLEQQKKQLKENLNKNS
jgi:hypothetical protein